MSVIYIERQGFRPGALTFYLTVLILFDDKIIKYSLEDGSLITERSLEEISSGHLTDFAGTLNYIKNGTKYESMVLSNHDRVYTLTSEKVIVLNDRFEVIGEVGFDQIYGYYLKTEKYRFLAKGSETIVIDDEHNEVAAFESSRRAFPVGNKLYEVKNNVSLVSEVTIHQR